MTNSKKGISLIVLVITIIVIIILAGAVILSLANNNPIAQASKAVYVQDKVAVQSAVNMFLAKIMAEQKAVATITDGTIGTTGTGTATYAAGAIPATEFKFGTGADAIGIAQPSYAATWSIDSQGVVSVVVNGTTY